MKFDSLHSYLEYCFSDKETVTDSMIQKAKGEYRKIYLSKYYKKYQKKHVQINFRVSQKQYIAFEKLAKKRNLKVSSYIKHLVLKSQNNNSHFDLKSFNLLLLKVIDIVEEATQEQEPVEVKELLLLLKQMQKQLL